MKPRFKRRTVIRVTVRHCNLIINNINLYVHFYLDQIGSVYGWGEKAGARAMSSAMTLWPGQVKFVELLVNGPIDAEYIIKSISYHSPNNYFLPVGC